MKNKNKKEGEKKSPSQTFILNTHFKQKFSCLSDTKIDTKQ